MIRSLILLNIAPCNGFVKKSATIYFRWTPFVAYFYFGNAIGDEEILYVDMFCYLPTWCLVIPFK
jgi:hypothetical protein